MPSIFYASDAGSLRHTWVPLVVWGTILAALGIVIAGLPTLTADVLVFLIGFGSVAAGLVWISWAVSLRRVTGGWWMFSFVPGVLLLVFGAYALLHPGVLAEFLFRAAGAVAAIWGLVDMTASWRWRTFFGQWWLRLLRGLIVAIAGVVVVFVPAARFTTMGLLIGIWFIVIGGVTIALGLAARRLPRSGPAMVVDGENVEPDSEPLLLP